MYSKRNLGKDQLRDLLELLNDKSTDANDKTSIVLLYIIPCENIDQL